MMDAGFRILTPLGTRIDLEKVNANLDALLEALRADAASSQRDAPRRMRETALQVAYLARLKAEALARNGRAFQDARHASA
jgi:hypothetical protein